MSRRSTLALSYRFKGRAIEGSGVSIAQAVGELSDLWNSRISLVMHSWGVMRVDVTIGGVTVAFEVTDPKVLDAAEEGRTQVLVAWMAEKSGITPEEMQLLLASATDVTASVDRIRPPNQPDYWQPDPAYDPDAALATAATEWGTALTLGMRGAPGAEKRKLVELVLKTGKKEGKSLSQISRETGIPRSTLSDAGGRAARKPKAAQAKRKPRQRLSRDEREAVLQLWSETGSAVRVEQELGVPARTVRDVVKRSRAAPEAQPARVRAPSSTRTGRVERADLRGRVVQLVESGLSASAAGRELGIPERTAREWVQKAKDFPED